MIARKARAKPASSLFIGLYGKALIYLVDVRQ
jgi:hypothetical protein